MDRPIVKYQCLECGAEFEAEQGSQRKFCDRCMVAKIMVGRPPKDPTQ